MKKSKKFLSVLLAISMILAMAVSASATGPLRSKPWDNEYISVGPESKPYDFPVEPAEPCIRVWVANTGTEGRLKAVVRSADGSTMGSADLGPGESKVIEKRYSVSEKEDWVITFSNGSTNVVDWVYGVFAVRTGTDWASMSMS